MNERIKDLLKQVRTQRHTENLMSNPPKVRYSYTIQENDLERFAELIVKECLDKISGLVIPEEAIQPVGSYEKWNQALGHAALEIEQHFYGDAHE